MPSLARIRLDAPLGAGAWGEVWRGVRDGVPVAVKVLRGDAALGPDRGRARLLLEDEIRAMARLDHPGIVPLLDHGLVPHDAPAPLSPGSPFLVMPLADASLDQRDRPRDLAGFLAVVEPLLGALAHLHARGLVHRDVKPANVLVYLRPERVMLGDLGIAWRDAAGLPERAGTVRYMAPEQADGRWRALGPWTDLFALGRLARELLSGDPDAERAPFAVPDRVWAWLARLTDPDPSARFRSAAEARRALGRPSGPSLPRGAAGLAVAPGSASSSNAEPTWRATTLAPPEADDAPPAPTGRLTLREAPLTGREALQEHLWRSTTTGAGLRLHLLVGPPGRGTSRLARWLGEAAHEATGTPTWRFSARDGGIRGGVRQRFHAAGLSGAALRAHLGALGAPEPEALTELLDDDTLAPAARASRLLVALSAEAGAVAPPVVWLDDVSGVAGPEGDEELTELVRLWLERGEPAATVVATAAAPPSGVVWSEAEILPLAPLAEADLAGMLERWLGLSPLLAAEIATRADGSPLVAEQLAEDLARRGLLVRSDAGWVHTPGATVALPATVQALWASRVAALGLSPEDRAAVEAAAVLGDAVDAEDWRVVAGVDPGPARRALLESGLALPDEAGIRFVHAQLRETILATADVAGLHARAAARLLERGADPGDVGSHLLAAGRPLDAFDPLAEGARRARAAGRLRRAATLADSAVVCATPLPDTDRRRALAWLLAARSRADAGEYRESARLFEESARLAQASGAWDLAGAAAFGLGDAANQAGDATGAARWLDVAREAFHRADDASGLAHVGAARFTLLRRAGRDVTGVLEEARAQAERSGDPRALGAVWLQIGSDASDQGRWDEAEMALEQARRHRPESPLPDHALAVVTAQRGDHAGALARFEALLVRTEAAGGSGARVASNVVHLLALLDRHDEARATVERWIPRARRAGRRLVLGNLLASGAAVALLQGDTDTFDAWAREAEAVWRDTRRPDPDLVALLERAAASADPIRAAVARELAELALVRPPPAG